VWRVQWDRGPEGWQPRDFTGILSIRKEGGAWSMETRFDQVTARYDLESMEVRGDRVKFTLHAPKLKGSRRWFHGHLRQGRLVGEMKTQDMGWTPFWGRRVEVKPLQSATAPGGLLAGDLAKASLEQKALDRLVRRAAEEQSSALVIVKDGKVVLEHYRDGNPGPVNAMSVSKSVVALVIGKLILEGKFNLNTRLSRLIKGWPRKGDKGLITIRHLLNHTSGLSTSRAGNKEMILRRALNSKVLFRPGTRFQYNNNAVDLLAAVVKQTTGEHLDAHLERNIFKPMGILDTSWNRDPEGVPLAAGSLSLRPVDLAKIGLLMLQKGMWQGKQLVPRKWVALMLKQGSPLAANCGLLWWRKGPFSFRLTGPALKEWGRVGVPPAVIKKANALQGKAFPSRDALLKALEEKVGKEDLKTMRATLTNAGGVPLYYTKDRGPVTSFSAAGWLGQRLIIVPEHKLVAVRMRQNRPLDYKTYPVRDTYPTFEVDVEKLIKPDRKKP